MEDTEHPTQTTNGTGKVVQKVIKETFPEIDKLKP